MVYISCLPGFVGASNIISSIVNTVINSLLCCRFHPRVGGYAGQQVGQQLPPLRHQTPHPVSLSRAPSGHPRPSVRHEPYPAHRPGRQGSQNFDTQQAQGQATSAVQVPVASNNVNSVSSISSVGASIKTEPNDSEHSNQSVIAHSPTVTGNRNGVVNEDSRSESSLSTLPNDPSDLRVGEMSVPQAGLSLDSDLSSLILPAKSSSSSEISGHNMSGMDTSGVSVKQENADDDDDEIDLEITGVELGMPQQFDMDSSQDWSQQGQQYMTGGVQSMSSTGGKSDMLGQQGYSKCLCLFWGTVESFRFTGMPFRGLKTRDMLVECGHLSSILERKQLPFVVLNKNFLLGT